MAFTYKRSLLSLTVVAGLALGACSSAPSASMAAPAADSAVGQLVESTPSYVSHRLAGKEYPEMTTRGMQASIDAGFKAFEYSVFHTKNGVYVGSHDWTTERLTGVRKEIWNTNWADLKDMDLAGGKFTRIEDIVEMMPSDGVLVLDHKTTSTKVRSHAADMASEEELFELLDSLFENPQERVIWKVFKDASSAERARERGYKTMGLLYSDQLQGVDFSRWDIIGLEHNAPQSAWDIVNSQGKPTIAHIVANRGQESRAFNLGADGIMSIQPYEVSSSRYEAP